MSTVIAQGQADLCSLFPDNALHLIASGFRTRNPHKDRLGEVAVMASVIGDISAHCWSISRGSVGRRSSAKDSLAFKCPDLFGRVLPWLEQELEASGIPEPKKIERPDLTHPNYSYIPDVLSPRSCERISAQISKIRTYNKKPYLECAALMNKELGKLCGMSLSKNPNYEPHLTEIALINTSLLSRALGR